MTGAARAGMTRQTVASWRRDDALCKRERYVFGQMFTLFYKLFDFCLHQVPASAVNCDFYGRYMPADLQSFTALVRHQRMQNGVLPSSYNSDIIGIRKAHVAHFKIAFFLLAFHATGSAWYRAPANVAHAFIRFKLM
jgi:hypothetical protein